MIVKALPDHSFLNNQSMEETQDIFEKVNTLFPHIWQSAHLEFLEHQKKWI